MAKLTTKARKKLKTSQFAGPNRSYPVEDRSHAANAKGRAAQMLSRGLIPQSEYDTIVSRANSVLGK